MAHEKTWYLYTYDGGDYASKNDRMYRQCDKLKKKNRKPDFRVGQSSVRIDCR